ncbi:MAG: RNA methyltransferase [Olsenella sp.]|jgi:tRNA G18 (ribose-2'-O)-methylase SpoU|nr:RNA methyltransferase [Olsenella sp.]MCI2127142.1 RNA methyltransferase [Olsenella sp.]MCI2184241.1 RNA methyltransferase [Olsenella sp.]MCI2187929.1 RNA methyltransferase [Olsenella sp.]
MQVTRIENAEDSRLDAYVRLTDRQLRSKLEPEKALLIAESRLVVEVALDAGIEPLSFLVDEARLESCADLIERAGCVAYVLPHDQMERLTGFNVNRGLLCAMRRPQPQTVEQVLLGTRHVAVLEGLVDVTNVGAVFRSAAALGADAVLLSPRCADPLGRRAVRVSVGTVFQVPWARVEAAAWPEGIVDELQNRGFTCLSMALEEGAVPIDDPSVSSAEKVALFFGCEGYGLSRAALNAVGRSVIIPMSNGVDSLNVAASSAVAFWELFARRR